MKQLQIVLFFSLLLSNCANSQNSPPRLVGAPCEGCEAIFEYGNRQLSNTDTLADFEKQGVQIKVEGTIYLQDEKTAANNVILYIYHTNQEGVYEPSPNADGWGKKHGYNRTWLKTDENGYYSFYTLKPAPYPNRSDPAHIHYEILEPNGKYYYLPSCHFEGDSLLGENHINPRSPRGGHSGLLRFRREGNLLIARRDIILGRNIPDYE